MRPKKQILELLKSSDRRAKKEAACKRPPRCLSDVELRSVSERELQSETNLASGLEPVGLIEARIGSERPRIEERLYLALKPTVEHRPDRIEFIRARAAHWEIRPRQITRRDGVEDGQHFVLIKEIQNVHLQRELVPFRQPYPVNRAEVGLGERLSPPQIAAIGEEGRSAEKRDSS